MTLWYLCFCGAVCGSNVRVCACACGGGCGGGCLELPAPVVSAGLIDNPACPLLAFVLLSKVATAAASSPGGMSLPLVQPRCQAEHEEKPLRTLRTNANRKTGGKRRIQRTTKLAVVLPIPPAGDSGPEVEVTECGTSRTETPEAPRFRLRMDPCSPCTWSEEPHEALLPFSLFSGTRAPKYPRQHQRAGSEGQQEAETRGGRIFCRSPN